MKVNTQGVIDKKRGIAKFTCEQILLFLKSQGNEKNHRWLPSADLWKHFNDTEYETELKKYIKKGREKKIKRSGKDTFTPLCYKINPETINRQLKDLGEAKIIEKTSFVPEPTRRGNKRQKLAVYYRISLAYLLGCDLSSDMTLDQLVLEYGKLHISHHDEGGRLLTAINILYEIESSNPEIFKKMGISDIPSEIKNRYLQTKSRMKQHHTDHREMGGVGLTEDLEKPFLMEIHKQELDRKKNGRALSKK